MTRDDVAIKILLLLCLLSLAGCGQDHVNNEIGNSQKNVNEGVNLSLISPSPVEMFTYDNSFTYKAYNLKSPFVSSVNNAVENAVKENYASGENVQPDLERMPEPLQSFALSELGMVGIIASGDMTWALIEDSEGLVHKATHGSYIGLDYGKIIGIDNAGVDIVEVVAAELPGKWIERKQHISMK